LGGGVMSFDPNAIYTTRLDEASATVTYVGLALVGSSEASAVWQIKRITVTGNITDIKFADGDFDFDNVWNNRACLSY
jgi:hypothetical protein